MNTTSNPSSTHGHAVLDWALILVSAFLIVLATFTVTMQQVLLNTERWVATVGPLASDPNVQTSLAAAAASQTTKMLDQGVQSLPPALQRLAAPVASGRNGLVYDQ